MAASASRAEPEDQPALADSAEAATVPDENGYYPGADVYVSVRANVWMRSGPGSNYRIVAVTHPGEKFKFRAYSKDNKFIQVDGENGSYWMQAHDLQAEPCAGAKEAILQKQIDELQQKLDNYDTELSRKYTATQKKADKLETENAGLKKALSERDNTIQEMDISMRDISDKLETKELDMQMRWWAQGAVIIFCGIITGVILAFLPRPNRKKRERERF